MNDPSVPEAEKYSTLDVYCDTYFNVELAIQKYSNGPGFSHVMRHLIDKDGLPIRKSSDKSIFNTHVYEIEKPDGHKVSLVENAGQKIYFPNLMVRGIDTYHLRISVITKITDHISSIKILLSQNKMVTTDGGRQ